MGLLTRFRRRAEDATRAAYASEVVLYVAVSGGSLTLRDFAAPGVRTSWGKSTMRWVLVLTDRRLVLTAGDNRYRQPIDTPWSDPHLAQMQVSVDDRGKLLLEFRAEDFRTDSSGQVQARLKLPDAEQARLLIETHRSR